VLSKLWQNKIIKMERDSHKGKDALIHYNSFLFEVVQVFCKIRIITKHKGVIEVT